MTDTKQHSDTSARTRSRFTLENVTAWWSAVVAAAGLWWLLSPSGYPLGSDTVDDVSLVSWVPAPWGAGSLLVLGMVGVTTALALRSPPETPAAGRVLTWVSAGLAVVFGLVLPDVRVLGGLGYLCAIVGPVVLVGLLAAGARRERRNRLLLGGLVVLVGFGLWASGAGLADLGAFFGDLGAGLAEAGAGMLTVTVSFVGGWLWLLSAIRFRRHRRQQCVGCGRPGPRWLTAESARRWGRWVTVAAALGPLPYGLSRMTWLTPWPYLLDAQTLADAPALRIFGLCLGLAAIGGSVLTLGLLRPWSEVFPRWLPVLRGRPVPVIPATAAALVVAGAVTIAGRSVGQQIVQSNSTEMQATEYLLLFPFPIWGPMLGAAALAYYLRRRGGCEHCGRSDRGLDGQVGRLTASNNHAY